MKADFHFHFYSRLGIIAALLFALFFVSQSVKTPVTSQAAMEEIGLTNWAWSGSAGWVSLNCYNDFNGDGEMENNCAANGGVDYGLEIVNIGDVPYVQDCAWAGTPLNVGNRCSDNSSYCTDDSDCTAPATCQPITLGWICFSDPPGLFSNAPGNGIPTSTTYLNALDPSYYASILSLENYFVCNGGTDDGKYCLPSDPLACPGGACEEVPSWAINFPIQNEYQNFPSVGDPINGCFNCYEEYTYQCSIDNEPCNPTDGCGLTTDIPPQAQTCVVKDVNYNCDNCLEYSYYEWPTFRCADTGTYCTQGDQSICNAEGLGGTCTQDSLYTMLWQCTGTGTNCTVSKQSTCDTEGSGACVAYDEGDLESVVGAYDCSDCTIESYDNTCVANAYQTNLNSCNSCASAYLTPGLMIDNKHNRLLPGEYGSLCGWGWNGWSIGGNNYSLGWMQFAPKVDTSTKPYISAGGGNIYSKGNILGRYFPPYGYANSSFLIESGGSITNFVSSSTLAKIYQGEMPNRPAIDFLSLVPNGKYENALGTIDYFGLITKSYGTELAPFNKYGSRILTLDALDDDLNIYFPGKGKVIYRPDNLSITTPLTVKVGEAIDESGSATVVVDGNLTIEKNIYYDDSATVDNLKQIPSVVLIVKGDVYVDPSVTEIAGTFVILGNGNSCAVPDNRYACGSGDDPSLEPDAGCGQLISCTGDATTCAVSPLQINGNVLARQFELCRTYYDEDNPAPSEYFFNDGRLQVNPPPGFSDFSKVVPRFSETPN